MVLGIWMTVAILHTTHKNLWNVCYAVHSSSPLSSHTQKERWVVLCEFQTILGFIVRLYVKQNKTNKNLVKCHQNVTQEILSCVHGEEFQALLFWALHISLLMMHWMAWDTCLHKLPSYTLSVQCTQQPASNPLNNGDSIFSSSEGPFLLCQVESRKAELTWAGFGYTYNKANCVFKVNW